jgi:hypothetical protein
LLQRLDALHTIARSFKRERTIATDCQSLGHLMSWVPAATAKAAQDGVAPYTSLFFAGYIYSQTREIKN